MSNTISYTILSEGRGGSYSRPRKLAACLGRLCASPPADPVRSVAVPCDGMHARRPRALAEGIELPGALHPDLEIQRQETR